MPKVVINIVEGGFALSDKAIALYKEKTNDFKFFYVRDLKRDDPILIQVVETLGKEANGRYAKLKIVTIPDDVIWYIVEYDGAEMIVEKHRQWS